LASIIKKIIQEKKYREVGFREVRFSLRCYAKIEDWNEIGVPQASAKFGPGNEAAIIIWAVGYIQDNFPAQYAIVGKPTTMRSVEPQLATGFITIFEGHR
jgi:hypothetical protein